MGEINAKIGDLFASDASTLVNTVNCVGVMGKGVAAEFKRRYPAMFGDYVRRCELGEVKLGRPYIYRDLSGVQIVNFPTKNHWRSASRLSDVASGLKYLVDRINEWDIESIAIPPLGCGNGGLNWVDVGPLIYQSFAQHAVRVELFAPYGTPKHKLSAEFLSSNLQNSLLDKGEIQRKLNREWIALTEVLRELESQKYASPVGRTIFQKICYVVTEMGVNTEFEFNKGSYGPFSSDVKEALHDFANRNWIVEQPLGKMIAIKTTPQYSKERIKYKNVIDRYSKKIFKTVDLFSRVKNTEQAEEIVTVLFAIREIKRSVSSAGVEENDVLDFIMKWKKNWNEAEKKRSVAAAIRNLVLLNWAQVSISEPSEDIS